ncbi:MAG TPA: hypothetical protein VD731_06935 [Nitrosopumilaceae archaeon]|nr:hypothetical protein [Nitrosopumilaceae archaeon]
MAEPEIIPFAVWSIIASIIVVVTGLSYRAFSRRKIDAESSS